MSTKVETRVFQEIFDTSRFCMEVETYDSPSHTLAYVTEFVTDSAKGVFNYDISIFGVGETFSRKVERKTLAGAQAYLGRHLENQGYDKIKIDFLLNQAS